MPAENKSPFFNKHIIAALIVTPILAIIAWLGIDYSLREKPHAAVAGRAYELAVLPNCRYQSGRCSMKNGDIEINLEMARAQTDGVLITLQSSLPLDGVRIALIDNANASATPASMQQSNPEGTRWQTQAPPAATDQSRLRVAIAVHEAHYFAEVPTLFSEYHTSFKRDFRRHATKAATTMPPTDESPL